jgi:hypothetical protein
VIVKSDSAKAASYAEELRVGVLRGVAEECVGVNVSGLCLCRAEDEQEACQKKTKTRRRKKQRKMMKEKSKFHWVDRVGNWPQTGSFAKFASQVEPNPVGLALANQSEAERPKTGKSDRARQRKVIDQSDLLP